MKLVAGAGNCIRRELAYETSAGLSSPPRNRNLVRHARFSLARSAWKAEMLVGYISAADEELVEPAGVAPAFPVCRTGVLLLDHDPERMDGAGSGLRSRVSALPMRRAAIATMPASMKLEPRVGRAPTFRVYETRASLSTLAGRETWRPPSDSHRVRSGLQPDASTTSAWQSKTSEQRWDLHPHRLLHREKCC